jgi:hypothetical protein
LQGDEKKEAERDKVTDILFNIYINNAGIKKDIKNHNRKDIQKTIKYKFDRNKEMLTK